MTILYHGINYYSCQHNQCSAWLECWLLYSLRIGYQRGRRKEFGERSKGADFARRIRFPPSLWACLQARFFTVKYTMVSLYFDWLLFSITWSIWKYKTVHVFIDCKWSLFRTVRRAWCERKLREKNMIARNLGDEKRASRHSYLSPSFYLRSRLTS